MRKKYIWMITIAVLIVIVIVLAIILGIFVGGLSPSHESKDEHVHIVIQSSNTKELWMKTMVDKFLSTHPKLTNGKPINITLYNTGSSLEYDYYPTIWSPANEQYIRLYESTNRITLISNMQQFCMDTTDIPVGIAMWKSRAQILGWPNRDISFNEIGKLAKNSSGWGIYNKPWGDFKFGHGYADLSNTGRLSVVANIYANSVLANPSRTNITLTIADVKNASTNKDVIAVEQSVYHLGQIDTALLDKMRNHGPDYLDAVASYESNVINWNIQYKKQFTSWNDSWAFIYLSDGTFWMNHPLCILNKASWVSQEQATAAAMFVSFATQTSNLQQLLQYGIRPTPLAGIEDMTCCGSTILPKYGGDPSQNHSTTPVIPYPTDNVMNEVLQTWHQIKKTSCIAMIVDTSGSMGEVNSYTQSRLEYAKTSVKNFIDSVEDHDYLIAYSFNDIDISKAPHEGRKGQVRKQLVNWANSLNSYGGTPLFKAMWTAWQHLTELKNETEKNGTRWNFGMVILTDGDDSTSKQSERTSLLSVYPNTVEESTDPYMIRIFPILFEYDTTSDSDSLIHLAQVSGGAYFQANKDNLDDIYYQISLEF